jgi:hypothetical protein
MDYAPQRRSELVMLWKRGFDHQSEHCYAWLRTLCLNFSLAPNARNTTAQDINLIESTMSTMGEVALLM